MRLKQAICVMLASMSILCAGAPAFAEGSDAIVLGNGLTVIPKATALDEVNDPTGTLVQKYHFAGVYYVPGTEDADGEVARTKSAAVLAGLFPATLGVHGGCAPLSEPLKKVEYNGDDICEMARVQQSADLWCAQNLPLIIASGTDQNTAATKIVQYVADHCSYAFPDSAHGVPIERQLGQTALPVLYDGIGVCANYAAAVNTMIHYLPIDPTTGLVSWECATPAHIPVSLVALPNHERSSAFIGDKWRVMDPTWYDNTRSAGYLDM